MLLHIAVQPTGSYDCCKCWRVLPGSSNNPLARGIEARLDKLVQESALNGELLGEKGNINLRQPGTTVVEHSRAETTTPHVQHIAHSK